MADAVVKVFVRAGLNYVMSRKRAPGRTADGRLEHLGGHMEAGESEIDAMVREAREEESTGLLAALLERVHPVPRKVKVGPDTQPHFIFDLTVDESEALSFVADSKESYGFELIPAERLDRDTVLAEMRAVLTPMTMAIYTALGRRG